jgi:hypothetical protein
MHDARRTVRLDMAFSFSEMILGNFIIEHFFYGFKPLYGTTYSYLRAMTGIIVAARNAG